MKGSIGTCFSEREIIFVADLTRSPDWPVYYKAGDERNYRSLAATPVFNLDKKRSPARGVLVVTSSEPKQFDEQIYRPIFTSLATILAIFFWVADKKLPEGVDYLK
jgi:signal transduction protein with GAF and PtsI domain